MTSIRNTIAFVLAAAVTTACTSVPKPDAFLSNTSGLQAAKGFRGKRLATVPPPLPPEGAPLFIESPVFTSGALIDPALTEPERALVLNMLARKACRNLSKPFDIKAEADPSAWRLRIGVSQMTATGRAGAAIGSATGFLSPIGVRPPVGLGALTVEWELIDPASVQAAAMVWAQQADMASGGIGVSRIGDAYGFAGMAADDFSDLVKTSSKGKQAAKLVGAVLPGGGKSDGGCDIYGKEGNRLLQAVRFLGLPVPPESTDKGAKPESADRGS